MANLVSCYIVGTLYTTQNTGIGCQYIKDSCFWVSHFLPVILGWTLRRISTLLSRTLFSPLRNVLMLSHCYFTVKAGFNFQEGKKKSTYVLYWQYLNKIHVFGVKVDRHIWGYFLNFCSNHKKWPMFTPPTAYPLVLHTSWRTQ